MLLPAISGAGLHDEPRLLQFWAYLMAGAAGLACLLMLWDLAFFCIVMSLAGLILAYQKAAGVR